MAMAFVSSVCPAEEVEDYSLTDDFQVPLYYPSPPEFRGPFARFRGWLFRRYAGSVEMETKTEYPKTYRGTYTYRYWRPDWIVPPHAGPFYMHDPGMAPAEAETEAPQDPPPSDAPPAYDSRLNRSQPDAFRYDR